MLHQMDDHQLIPSSVFYVGAYWRPRLEPLQECADRATLFFSELRRLDEAFDGWYEQGLSRSAAVRSPVRIDFQSVVAKLAAGRNRTDFGDEVIEELGYTMSLWNGQKEAVSVSLSCGRLPGPYSGWNAVVLNLSSVVGVRIANSSAATAILRLLIESWSPEWATWSTAKWRFEQGWRTGRVAGWMTYVETVGEGARLPKGVRAEPLGSGLLLTVAQTVAEVDTAQLRRALSAKLV